MRDKQRPSGILPISRDDLEQFFAEAGIAPHCKECGSESYTPIFEFQSKIPAIPFTDEPGSILLDLRMPSYITICDKCGYIRSFNRLVINAWKEEKLDRAGGTDE